MTRKVCRAVIGALITLMVLFAVPAAAIALEPPFPGELARYRRDGTLVARQAFARKLGDWRTSKSLVRRLHNRLLRAARTAGRDTAGARLLPPTNWRGLPTTGTNKILVLCIDFSDYTAQSTLTTINSAVFGTGVSTNYPYESLHGYYDRASYGQLDLQGKVVGWYRPSYARTAMTQTSAGRENLIQEALQHYDTSVDYSQFDNNGDGVIDYLAVLWSGPSTGWGSFWWPYQTSWSQTTAPALDGVTPGKYVWEGEATWSKGEVISTFWPRTLIHETGHMLGLPDLYDYLSRANGDTVGPDGGVGDYDMMDADDGDFNMFSKWLLGWVDPTVISWVTRTQTLAPSCSNQTGSSLVVMPGADGGWDAEFFLIQNRYKVHDSNDRYMPGSHGLQVWHIDARLNADGSDFLYNNSYTAHKLVRLQEADGLEEIENGDTTTGSRTMDAGDYYVVGAAFLPSGTPNSLTYAGADTGVTVDTIAESSGNVTFRVIGGNDCAAPTTTCNQMIWLGWYTTSPTLTFSAVDTGGSGVDTVQYRVDDGDWQDGASVTLGSGVHVLQYRAVDNAENVETAHTATLNVDTAPPVTTCDELGGWHARSRPVRFYASDDVSGVASTSWRVGDGDWHAGDALPAHCWRRSPSGEYTIEYASRDVAGVCEAVNSVVFKLDHTPPVTTDDAPTSWVAGPVTITLTSADAHSGVAATWYSRNGGDWVQATILRLARSLVVRTDTIAYYSVDSVGNAEAIRTVKVTYGGQILSARGDGWPASMRRLALGSRREP